MKTDRKIKATKAQLCAALAAFIAQRSGIEWGNYGGSREAFMGDYRPILKHGKHARQLLRAVELRDGITAADMIEASQAYSGRLQFVQDADGVRVDYCTGQYFPTEYRKSACAVLASALWGYWRANMPKPNGKRYEVNDKGERICETETYDGLSAGEYLRKQARREFGRSIAATWFN